MACVDANTAAAFAAGLLSLVELEQIRGHAESCAACRRMLVAMAVQDTMRADPDDRVANADLPGGTRIGRFEIVDRLGRGGMGTVYRALDPELDRMVALKIWHFTTTTSAAQARQSLLAEARTLARLAHPNIVAVHEVGTFDDEVFIAMELIKGESLRQWLENDHTPAEILRVLCEAGRGLHAAHAAGIVHRDFKPDNVVVGSDERVRVIDFGLARAPARKLEAEGADEMPAAQTHTAIAGTPAYMSPEQHRGEHADSRSDQFSFCVTLYEAMCGRRPFAGAGGKLVGNTLAGNILDPPGSHTPRWLVRLWNRGLAPAMEDRFPSMAPLVAELGHDRARRRRVMLGVGLAALVALIVGAGLSTFLAGPSSELTPRCPTPFKRLAGVWDPAIEAALQGAFAATGRGYAEETHSLVKGRLDRYRDEWLAMHVSSCEQTFVHAEQSEQLFDLRKRCLDRRLSELRQLTAVLSQPGDDSVLRNATIAVNQLTPLARCADADALRAVVPPPADPALAAAVSSLRARIEHANSLMWAGQYAEALPLAEQISTEADAIAYPAVQGEAQLLLGLLLRHATRLDEAETAARAAMQAAAEARDDKTVAAAAIQLLDTVGTAQARYKEALALRAVTEAVVARAGNEPLQRAFMLDRLGTIRSLTGEHAQARDLRAEALAVLDQAGNPDHYRYAKILNNLAVAYFNLNDFEVARKHMEDAHARLELALGANHPEIGAILSNLGMIATYQERDDDALSFYERSLAIKERAYGRDHLELTYPLTSLAGHHLLRGNPQEAYEACLRALSICEKHLPPEHPEVEYNLTCTAQSLLNLDRPDEALPYAERAYSIQAGVMSKDPSEGGLNAWTLARALWYSGKDRERARALMQEAHRLYSTDAEHYGGVLADIEGLVSEARR